MLELNGAVDFDTRYALPGIDPYTAILEALRIDVPRLHEAPERGTLEVTREKEASMTKSVQGKPAWAGDEISITGHSVGDAPKTAVILGSSASPATSASASAGRTATSRIFSGEDAVLRVRLGETIHRRVAAVRLRETTSGRCADERGGDDWNCRSGTGSAARRWRRIRPHRPRLQPGDGRAERRGEFASVDEIDRAVLAAKAASTTWRTWSLSKRAELFFRIYQLLDEHREGLARLLTAEHGSVLSDALGEVQRGIEVVEYVCGIPELLKGDYSEQASTGIDVYSIRQPLGVVAGITLFNFPAMVPMWMWALRDACGNTFVLKPSEKDPPRRSSRRSSWKEAGLPGRRVQRRAGRQGRGRRDPPAPGHRRGQLRRVDPDRALRLRDRDEGGEANAGAGRREEPHGRPPRRRHRDGRGRRGERRLRLRAKRCMAVSVVVAVGDAGDELVGAIKQRLPKVGRRRVRSLLGDGPVVTREHRDKVALHLDRAPRRERPWPTAARPHRTTGLLLGVSLLDDVTPEMDAYRDEIFGPVLSVVRVPTYDEALRLVNENPYGNGVAPSRDGGVARQFQFDVNVGMVGINVPIPCPSRTTCSAAGRACSSATGTSTARRGIDFYTRTKAVTSRWSDPATSKVDLGFPQTR